MSDLTEIKKAIAETKEDVAYIKIALKGYDGQEGLCKKVDRNSRSINKIYISLAVLAATTGGGAYGIIHAILSNITPPP